MRVKVEQTTHQSESECGGFKGERAGGVRPSSSLFPVPSYFTPIVLS